MDESLLCKGPVKVLEGVIENDLKNFPAAIQAFQQEYISSQEENRQFLRDLAT